MENQLKNYYFFPPLKGHFENRLSEGSGKLRVQFAWFEKCFLLHNLDWENSPAWWIRSQVSHVPCSARYLKAIAKEYFSPGGSMREVRIKVHTPYVFNKICSNHSETSNYFTNVREHWWDENSKLLTGEKSVRFKCQLCQEMEDDVILVPKSN